jgi:hypothetical protein
MNTKKSSLSDLNYPRDSRNRKSTAKIDSASAPAYRYTESRPTPRIISFWEFLLNVI